MHIKKSEITQTKYYILYVFLKYKFKDAEEMPFLQQPEVRIKGPHSLSIKVREKKIAGYLYVPAMGQNAYFNKDGGGCERR